MFQTFRITVGAAAILCLATAGSQAEAASAADQLCNAAGFGAGCIQRPSIPNPRPIPVPSGGSVGPAGSAPDYAAAAQAGLVLGTLLGELLGDTGGSAVPAPVPVSPAAGVGGVDLQSLLPSADVVAQRRAEDEMVRRRSAARAALSKRMCDLAAALSTPGATADPLYQRGVEALTKAKADWGTVSTGPLPNCVRDAVIAAAAPAPGLAGQLPAFSTEGSIEDVRARGEAMFSGFAGAAPPSPPSAQSDPCASPGTADASVVDLRCAGERVALLRNPSPPPLASEEQPMQVLPTNYRPSGNGLVGGTTWIAGYNAPRDSNPEMIAAARRMVQQQAALAGIPYDAAVDFERYNFAIGLAASNGVITDLTQRVLFDQLRNGRATTDMQSAYASLRHRSFDELGCHSNGAMICLAALENRDVVAERVVLYGPQITAESLELWQGLIAARRVKSVEIYVNENDPVPPLALAFGGRESAGAALFKKDVVADIVRDISPDIKVNTFSCGGLTPTLDCHDLRIYSENRKRLEACGSTSGATVPGTRLRGDRGVAEPPSPC